MDAASFGAFLLDILETAIDHRIERIELALLAPRPVVAAGAWPALRSAVTTIAAPGSAVAALTFAPGSALAIVAALTLAARAGLALSFRSRDPVAWRTRPTSAARPVAATGSSLRLAFGRCGSILAGAAQLRWTAATSAARPRRQRLAIGSEPWGAGHRSFAWGCRALGIGRVAGFSAGYGSGFASGSGDGGQRSAPAPAAMPQTQGVGSGGRAIGNRDFRRVGTAFGGRHDTIPSGGGRSDGGRARAATAAPVAAMRSVFAAFRRGGLGRRCDVAAAGVMRRRGRGITRGFGRRIGIVRRQDQAPR
ncbi:MAG TPA: hypothetical protein VN808_08345 [Stellaceae bacterium]|nr:hypothetical protein [Stellaceae bacterium]